MKFLRTLRIVSVCTLVVAIVLAAPLTVLAAAAAGSGIHNGYTYRYSWSVLGSEASVDLEYENSANLQVAGTYQYYLSSDATQTMRTQSYSATRQGYVVEKSINIGSLYTIYDITCTYLINNYPVERI